MKSCEKGPSVLSSLFEKRQPFAGVIIASFAAVFWMSRNAPPLRDIQKTATKETGVITKAALSSVF